ncbi:MAG: class I SAM-dependent methyltransferase [Spirochaetota bacterium]
MNDKILSPYSDPARHAATTDIIKRLSANKIDIRNVALSRVNMASAHDVLDLGCGFGFMSEMIASMAGKDTRITGVDAREENRQAFIKTVSEHGSVGLFENFTIDKELPYINESFDLIVCTYSLYFFSGIIKEIARVLRQNGTFIAITHSKTSFKGLYEAAGLKEEKSILAGLIKQFSAENGREKLSPYFATIEKLDYSNSLHFESSHVDLLKEYIRFKLPLLREDAGNSGELPADMEQKIENSLSEKGKVIVEKHDAIFRCRGPVCQ